MTYDGPKDLSHYSEFFPRIGELIVSFGIVENWMMAAIMMSCRLSQSESEQLERKKRSFSARIDYLSKNGQDIAEETNASDHLLEITSRLREAAEYRNLVAHHILEGKSAIGSEIVALRKRRYGEEVTDVYIFFEELRDKTKKNIALRDLIREWFVICECHRRDLGEANMDRRSASDANLFHEAARVRGYI